MWQQQLSSMTNAVCLVNSQPQKWAKVSFMLGKAIAAWGGRRFYSSACKHQYLFPHTCREKKKIKELQTHGAEFEVSLCDVSSMTPTLSMMIEAVRTHTLTHTNITPSMSLTALRWAYPPPSLTSPSSAISFVFGQMQCSGPGGSNTVCGAITQIQSVITHSDFTYFFPFCSLYFHCVCKIWAQQEGFLWAYKAFFQYEEKFVIPDVMLWPMYWLIWPVWQAIIWVEC